jgi:hypothetical protein
MTQHPGTPGDDESPSRYRATRPITSLRTKSGMWTGRQSTATRTAIVFPWRILRVLCDLMFKVFALCRRTIEQKPTKITNGKNRADRGVQAPKWQNGSFAPAGQELIARSTCAPGRWTPKFPNCLVLSVPISIHLCSSVAKCSPASGAPGARYGRPDQRSKLA